ncbi:MAG: peptidylprolyl isomerase [Parcubacteria group bacterium Gr01-1014_48]|nr:MAG: peptidylprolyl isomerase [Parcubacteria group bacterium Greene0416_14]TSC72798.1 MAG: peptidylprolyl isomerase [Parcubacteria group bacterium Gr01-1014_48]TSD00914.1 MAG: peptidylprolyl isomerase [Parcubacteria group bacterium Greene1014_15]TSD07996.1 MAG: peptidylprolyl isomerase [Parcubacteria group bacterium Greene0714_4]
MKNIIIIGIIIIIGVLWFIFDRNSLTAIQLRELRVKNAGQEEKPAEVKTEKTDMQKGNEKNPIVVLKTNKGDISIELFMDTMPVTAGNFLKLAKEDFYDGVKFHRVIKDFMLQGGDPNSKGDDKSSYGTGGPGYTIKDEFVPGNANNRGTISMANAGPDTGGSQFFVNLKNNDFLNDKHPVFGKVVEGMDVVDTIGTTETDAGDLPVEAVVIKDIEVKE